ncbi:MAG TPA: hypothetical protein DIW77_00750 [Chromatiaceae bacterium]|jgi:hypothetical protein|nr:hypothetical protein [Chromatiaceae bacterium]
MNKATCCDDTEKFALVYQDLIFDNRCDRAGWPLAVWEELIWLQEICDMAIDIGFGAHGSSDAG